MKKKGENVTEDEVYPVDDITGIPYHRFKNIKTGESFVVHQDLSDKEIQAYKENFDANRRRSAEDPFSLF